MHIPEILQPFDWSMALVALTWYFALALTVQRGATYCRRRLALARRARRPWQAAGGAAGAAWFEGQWRRDRLVQTWLERVKQLAPLFGLAGTVQGVLLAFGGIQGDTVDLAMLGPAIALALKTTLLGSLCAAWCIALGALPYGDLQEAEQAWLDRHARGRLTAYETTGDHPWRA